MAPSIFPYADLLQLVSPESDEQERDLCRRLDRQLVMDDQVHDQVRVIYLPSPRLQGKFDVGVFREYVLFQIVGTIAAPRATFDGAIQEMREVRPDVTIPFLPTGEGRLAWRAQV
jgi:hypothetical protein